MSKKINACKTIIIAEIGECFNGDFDAANKLMSSLGAFAGGAGIGIGVILLAAGFTVAVVGGFIILREAVAAAEHGIGS